MKKTLLIGVGNTLRGDDGAGVRVVQQLAERFPSITAVCTQELVPELAEIIADCDRLFCIDASVRCSELHISMLHACPEVAVRGSHNQSLEQLLSLAVELYRRRPAEAVLVEIPASCFPFGDTLSPHTAAMAEECFTRVSEMIAHHPVIAAGAGVDKKGPNQA